MKTPDEIKKGLESCGTTWCGPESCKTCTYSGLKCGNEMHDDALAYIQQLECERNAVVLDHLYESGFMAGFKAAYPKWIDVEERLPEDDEFVLVFGVGKYGSVVAMTSYTHHMYGYDIEGWRSPWDYFHNNYTVTHWMPLPEPPKEATP